MTSSFTMARSKALRIAHCAGFYFPDGVGGTEVYVHDLHAALLEHAIDGYVVAATDKSYGQYAWEGVPVQRYPSDWAGICDHAASRSQVGLSKFQKLILEGSPDIFHLHSWTSGAGLVQLSQVAALGIPCMVTMHVPSALCLRGTMVLYGERACDGRIDDRRCARCWSLSRGLPDPLAFAVSRLPPMCFRGRRRIKLWSRAETLLSARSLANRQARELKRMAVLCERIIAPSGWIHAALLANGIAPAKIIVSPQAVSPSLLAQAAARPRRQGEGEPLTIGFVGRLEPYKGAHILVEAMARIPPDIPIRLRIAGSGTEIPYLRSLEKAAVGDERIELCGSISREGIPDFLRQLDILAVPSNYMETGPIVVLEAFAFGVPVMGSNLGGIAERIRDGVDGWLLPFDDSRAWASAIQDAALDRARLARLAANVVVSRTMSDVAAEMSGIYREILSARGAQAAV